MLRCYLFLLWPAMEARRRGTMEPAYVIIVVGGGLLLAWRVDASSGF
jgi:hypothetical protein